jgi:hypothetical protein
VLYDGWEALDGLVEALHCEDGGGVIQKRPHKDPLAPRKARGLSIEFTDQEFGPWEGLQWEFVENMSFSIPTSIKHYRVKVCILQSFNTSPLCSCIIYEKIDVT